MTEAPLSGKRRQILEFIAQQVRDRGFPPSVREIGEAVGLTSSSTVHTHLQVLQRQGYLRRDPTKPRAIVVHFEPNSGAAASARRSPDVPLLGDVAAGTGTLAQQEVEDVLPLPEDLTGSGEALHALRAVHGDSMIEAGILDGDYVVVSPPRHRRSAATSSSPASQVVRPPSRRSAVDAVASLLSPRIQISPTSSWRQRK